MAKVIDKPTTIKRPIKRPIKTPDEYNDLVILQRIVVNAKYPSVSDRLAD
jgi:hypothetical protein